MQAIDSDRLLTIGYDSCAASCGTFMVLDHTVLEKNSKIKGLHVIPLNEAFEQYSHVKDRLFFHLVDREKNEFTRLAAGSEPVGYYVLVDEGVRIEEPMQAAFLFGGTDPVQIIHNIIELRPGAMLNIVNGCTTSSGCHTGRHIGITETYLGRDSSLGYTMLHNWGKDMEVFPVGAAMVEEGAQYLSNYVAMTSVKKIVSYPTAFVKSHATARFYSIIYAREASCFDTGAKTVLEGDGAGGEIISRVVSEGGTVISRQMISGNTKGSIGHMECSGLLLNEKGVIHSVPELRGEHPDINLSHEAAIGRISDEELSYLMTRGLTEDQARSLIIRGFLDIKIHGLPLKVQALVEEIIDRSVSGSI